MSFTSPVHCHQEENFTILPRYIAYLNTCIGKMSNFKKVKKGDLIYIDIHSVLLRYY